VDRNPGISIGKKFKVEIQLVKDEPPVEVVG
jgi:hypothetical protein